MRNHILSNYCFISCLVIILLHTHTCERLDASKENETQTNKKDVIVLDEFVNITCAMYSKKCMIELYAVNLNESDIVIDEANSFNLFDIESINLCDDKIDSGCSRKNKSVQHELYIIKLDAKLIGSNKIYFKSATDRKLITKVLITKPERFCLIYSYYYFFKYCYLLLFIL